MKFFLDTANFDEIKKWKNFIEGVTTNPLRLEEEGIEWFEWLDEFKEVQEVSLLPSTWNVFIQVLEEPDAGLLMSENFNFNITWKVTMNHNGYNISKSLKNKDYSVCATTVYDLAQLNFALENNFDYSMVYYHKNEDKDFLYRALSYRDQYHSDKDTKFVAASFRTKEEIIQVMKSGIEYATVRPEHLELLYTNRQSREDYKELYG